MEVQRRVLGEQYVAAKGNVTTRSDQAQIRLVESGMGIGVVGKMVVHQNDRVVIRRLNKSYARTIGLAVPSWKPVTPALRELIKLICTTYQDACFRNARKTP